MIKNSEYDQEIPRSQNADKLLYDKPDHGISSYSHFISATITSSIRDFNFFLITSLFESYLCTTYHKVHMLITVQMQYKTIYM